MISSTWMAQKMRNRVRHQQPGGFLGRLLNSTWVLAHDVGAQNDGRSSVLLDFHRGGRCRGPGRTVLSVAAAQFTRAYQPEAGSGDRRANADSHRRAASARSQKFWTGRFSVELGSSFVEPGLFRPGFFASTDRNAR